MKLTTEDYTDNPIIYIKSSADEVVAETTPKLGDDGTLEYVFTGEETDITLYYGTKDDLSLLGMAMAVLQSIPSAAPRSWRISHSW